MTLSPPANDWSFLKDRRIVDLSGLLPGPYATVLLADLGADVVKVEAPSGDLARINDRRFAAFNRNKRSVVLDLKSEGGRAGLLKLVHTADAVVDGFRPGVLDRLGIGWDVLHEVNPRLVLCSLSAFGQDGPYAGRPGHDINFLGMSGFFAVPARTDGVVTRPGVRVADMVGGLYAALSLAVAMASVDRTGVGQRLDVSLAETATACVAPFALSLPEGAPATDSELVMGDNDVFETSDGARLAFAPFEDKFWVVFREALCDEFPELDTDAFDDRVSRTLGKVEVGRILNEVFSRRSLAWWSERFSALDLPWTALVETPEDLLAHPVAAARELFADTTTHTGREMRQARFPTRFSHGLASVRSPAPALGEHTAELVGNADGH